MKVALCLSGHLRSYSKTIDSLNKFILKPLNPDVFIHTWDNLGIMPLIDGFLIKTPTITQRKNIEKFYNPKSFIIEKNIPNLGERYRALLVDKRSPSGIVSMFYKIYQADMLRQKYELAHGRYDLVIRARPDLLFESPINESEIKKVLENNIIYFPSFGHWDGLNDQFAFGNSDMMKIYSNCYMEISTIAKKIQFKPEIIMKEFMKKKKVVPQFSDIAFTIKRANGEIFDGRHHSPGVPNINW